MTAALVETPRAIVEVTRATSKLPEGLVQVHAYFKWITRCREAGREVHGCDKLDWHNAQGELIAKIEDASPDRLRFIVDLVLEANFSPSEDAIRKRAHNIWLQRNSTHPPMPGTAESDWEKATTEERDAIFAAIYLSAFAW